MCSPHSMGAAVLISACLQDAKQQRAACTVRKTALACLRELLPLLCAEGPRSHAKSPVHALLLADIAGSGGKAASGSKVPHLLRTPQTAPSSCTGQAS